MIKLPAVTRLNKFQKHAFTWFLWRQSWHYFFPDSASYPAPSWSRRGFWGAKGCEICLDWSGKKWSQVFSLNSYKIIIIKIDYKLKNDYSDNFFRNSFVNRYIEDVVSNYLTHWQILQAKMVQFFHFLDVSRHYFFCFFIFIFYFVLLKSRLWNDFLHFLPLAWHPYKT